VSLLCVCVCVSVSVCRFLICVCLISLSRCVCVRGTGMVLFDILYGSTLIAHTEETISVEFIACHACICFDFQSRQPQYPNINDRFLPTTHQQHLTSPGSGLHSPRLYSPQGVTSPGNRSVYSTPSPTRPTMPSLRTAAAPPENSNEVLDRTAKVAYLKDFVIDRIGRSLSDPFSMPPNPIYKTVNEIPIPIKYDRDEIRPEVNVSSTKKFEFINLLLLILCLMCFDVF